jgi:hypothetical protein
MGNKEVSLFIVKLNLKNSENPPLTPSPLERVGVRSGFRMLQKENERR